LKQLLIDRCSIAVTGCSFTASRDVLAYDTCVARHPQEQVLCEGPQQAPPIGATTSTLPSGAVSQTVNGVTYYSFGGAYYRPYYSGSSVFYEVVANPA
jgi:hypothetical protein